MNPSWLYFFLDLCIAAALLYGPGSVAFRFAGFRLEASICLAPSFSLSAFVVVGILLGLAGINVSNVKFLLICLLVTLVLLIVSGVFSRLCERKRLPHVQYDSQNGPTFSLIALYLLIAAIFVTVLFILPIDGPYSFSTSNDSSAHLDFIRVFVESGTYSTLHVSQDVSLVPLSGFYPAAYHVFCAALTALPGCTVTMASNIAVVVICGAVYPLGSLLVCSRLFGSRALETRAGALACVGNVGFPWAFLVWGHLASNLLAFALVPAFVFLFWELLFPLENRSFAKVFVSLSVVFFAMAIAQPNAVFTGGIFCIPIIFCFVRDRILVMNPSLHKSHFSRSLLSFLLVVSFVLAIWTLLYLSPFLSGIVHFYWSNDASLGQAFVSALELKYGGMFEIQYLVAPLLLLGFFLSLTRSSVKYVSWLYLFCTLLFIASYTKDFPLQSFFSGFWYTDYYRVGAMAAMCSTPLLCVAYSAIARAFIRLVQRFARVLRVSFCFAGSLVFLYFLLLPSFQLADGSWFDTPFGSIKSNVERTYSMNNLEGIDAEEWDFIGKCIPIVKDDVVINLPFDGSGMLYGSTGMNVVYRNIKANPSNLTDKPIRMGLCNFASDKRVSDCVRNLNAKYVLILDSNSPSGSIIPYVPHDRKDWSGIFDITENTPGFELVLSQGDMCLYKIDVNDLVS